MTDEEYLRRGLEYFDRYEVPNILLVSVILLIVSFFYLTNSKLNVLLPMLFLVLMGVASGLFHGKYREKKVLTNPEVYSKALLGSEFWKISLKDLIDSFEPFITERWMFSMFLILLGFSLKLFHGYDSPDFLIGFFMAISSWGITLVIYYRKQIRPKILERINTLKEHEAL